MLVSIIACVDLSAYAQTYSGTCGDNVTYTLDDDGVLTISGQGEMYDYDGSDSPFYRSISIKNIIIEDGVTGIGDYAFYECESLESIRIPASVLDIGKYVFLFCINLISIDVDINNKMYLSEDGILFNKIKSTLIRYPSGILTTFYALPESVIRIEDGAFFSVN